MNSTQLSVSGGSENQDRALVVKDRGRLLLCVADGAGGRSGGMEAAVLATRILECHWRALTDAEACVQLIRRLDLEVLNDAAAGETTCMVAVVTPQEVFGASVGDSGLWLFMAEGSSHELTRNQIRKPFVGSGSAVPRPFHLVNQPGVLLAATDGLLKYASAEAIGMVCRSPGIDVVPNRLVDLVRYPSGALPDDVTVVVVQLD